MQRYTLDDMFENMQMLSNERKNAIAFAVFTGLGLDQVIELKWSDELELDWRSEMVLTRIFELPHDNYVFYDATNDDRSKMISLPFIFWALNLNESWVSFANRFENCLPIWVSGRWTM